MLRRRLTRISTALAATAAGAALAAAPAPATTVTLHAGVRAHASIIGGYQPAPRIWPWMTALTFSPATRTGNDFDRQFCGGTLVAPRVVLTAAHCVTESDGSLTRAQTVQAVLGKDVLSAAGGEHLDVSAIVRHPRWDRDRLAFDLALLYLAAPSSQTPAQLITTDMRVPIGTMLTAMGWGRTTIGAGERVFADALKAVDLPLWSDAACDAADATWAGAGSYIADVMLCAGYTDAVDATCKGDSGGPLMLRDQAGTWRLLGAVSWGTPDCDRMGKPSNYAWLGNPEMLGFVTSGIAHAPAAPAAPAPAQQQPSPAPVQPRVVAAPPASAPAADAQAPRLGRVAVNPLVVHAGRSFRLLLSASEAARLTIRLSGPRGDRARGTTYTAGGATVLRLSSRVGRRPMRRGLWHVVVRATDGAGNASAPRTAWFSVVR